MLYDALKFRYGEVRVRNEGEAMIADYRKNPLTEEWYLDIEHPGEYYMICCPFCGDTRFRLNINHRWGVRDEKGHTNLWLAICFNEKCMQGNHQHRVQLPEEVEDASIRPLDKSHLLAGCEVKLEDIHAEWPGPVIRLDRLPKTHKAYQYILGRNFDPEKIGRCWKVHYCVDSIHYLARSRLIIPIFYEGELKGWQARYVGNLPKDSKWPPKYFTMPGTPRRMLLYNMASARRYETCVIVEGPTDVWSGGPMFVCTLGATMSTHQRRDVVAAFSRYSVVLCYDPEEFRKESVKALARDLTGKFQAGFACVKLPEGSDPGSLDRQFLRQYIAAEAKKQGVKVSWRKRV